MYYTCLMEQFTGQEQAEYEKFYRTGYFAGRWIRAELEKQAMFETNLNIARGLYRKQDQIDRLKGKARTDDLTGLQRRNSFMAAVRERFERKNRIADLDRRHAVLVLDLDNFKRINDELGHSIGDDCLEYTGIMINETVHRDNDLACRWGGEEFVVFLGDTDMDGARTVADKIQAAINEYSSGELEGSSSSRLGISIGIAEYPHGTDFMAAFKTADELLLLAKQHVPEKNQIFPLET